MIYFLKGTVFFVIMMLNTLVHCLVLFVFALARLVVPGYRSKVKITKVMNAIANSWIGVNSLCITVLHRPRWTLIGVEQLNSNCWYLLTANHQSWADILILQRVFHRKIPMLKFFLKQQLIWVPVIGLAWWALDFPFMKRYSREFLAKNPHLKGRDLAATRKACEKFKYTPTSILNFTEGTRFTSAKHHYQQSPYEHLLKPRAGGIAFALNAMGGRIDRVLDVTLCYPQKVPSFWEFLCHGCQQLTVEVREIPLSELAGYHDYDCDDEAKEQFQQSISAIWAEKDRRFKELSG